MNVIAKMQRVLSRAAVAAILTLPAMPAAAQTTASQAGRYATAADIQRLQDQVYDVSNEIARTRGRDTDLAGRLQYELDDARDEVIYLKVKLRKEGAVTRAEFAEVRNRLDDIRARARGGDPNWSASNPNSYPPSNPYPPYNSNPNPYPNPPGGYGAGSGSGSGGDPSGAYGRPPNSTYGGTTDPQNPAARPAIGRRNEVPAGQALDVRLENQLSSETAQVEDRFAATTVVDLYQGNDVLIPAGSALRGVVSSVTKATRMERKGAVTVTFDQITVRDRNYPIHATVSQALESEGLKGEAARISTGAGVGAILGGILGGAKGALLGILIGGGGTIAATEGTDVVLAPGTILRVRFDEPLLIR